MKFYLGAVLLGIGSGFLPEQQSPMGLLVMAIVFLVLGQIVRLIFPMQSLQYQSWVLENKYMVSICLALLIASTQITKFVVGALA